jgi:mRNA interferase RelE/StbE
MPRHQGRNGEASGSGGVRAGWNWAFTRPAQRQLNDLGQEVQERIIADLDLLVVDPRAVDARKLEGRDGYRLRVGSYRVLYDVDKQKRLFVVFWIGDRKDACR